MMDFTLYLRAGTLFDMFATEPLLLEQYVAHSRGSINICRINKLYLILGKGKEIRNIMPALQIIKYMGLPNSRFVNCT